MCACAGTIQSACTPLLQCAWAFYASCSCSHLCEEPASRHTGGLDGCLQQVGSHNPAASIHTWQLCLHTPVINQPIHVAIIMLCYILTDFPSCAALCKQAVCRPLLCHCLATCCCSLCAVLDRDCGHPAVHWSCRCGHSCEDGQSSGVSCCTYNALKKT